MLISPISAPLTLARRGGSAAPPPVFTPIVLRFEDDTPTLAQIEGVLGAGSAVLSVGGRYIPAPVSGKIAWVEVEDEPRYWHEPDKQPRGILLEDAITQHVRNNAAFQIGSGWFGSNLTTSQTITGPAGNAWVVDEGTATGAHALGRNVPSLGSNTLVCHWALVEWMGDGQVDEVRLYMRNRASQFQQVFFKIGPDNYDVDLTIDPGGLLKSKGIRYMGPGNNGHLFLIWAAWDTGSGTTDVQAYIAPYLEGQTNYTGTGRKFGLHAMGMDEAHFVPQMFVPAGASSEESRIADTLTIPGTRIPANDFYIIMEFYGRNLDPHGSVQAPEFYLFDQGELSIRLTANEISAHLGSDKLSYAISIKENHQYKVGVRLNSASGMELYVNGELRDSDSGLTGGITPAPALIGSDVNGENHAAVPIALFELGTE